jgi:phospho-2-dehydro-3-deoxyheptonate aldolase
METLLPTQAEKKLINAQRAVVASTMAAAGRPNTRQIAVPGPCSPDMNRMPNGELGAIYHVKSLAVVGRAATSSLTVVRYVAEKPRTAEGFTGIIHQPGGAKAYTEGAHQLHRAGIPFASEVISDVGAAIVVPHLTAGWIGTREVSATGPRYNVRPTNIDLENDIHPLPVWVKNGQDGGLAHTRNALMTILLDKPQARTRFGINGMEELMTYGNPHVGVILRGQSNRPQGNLEDILAEEVGTAREFLDGEFGKDRIPIMVDFSHDHAKYAGGGEAGQRRVAAAIGSLMPLARIDGWSAETYIHAGKQPADGGRPGLSITDECIGQQGAEELMLDMNALWAASPLMISVEPAVTTV